MSDKVRILIVDDEDVVVASCIRALASDGYELSSASSGEEALDKLEAGGFDVALLDLRIPRPGGLMLLRHIRSAYPETQVIVITGHPTLENAKEATQLGAFDYVCKPLHPERVRSVVARAIARRTPAFSAEPQPFERGDEMVAANNKSVLIVDDEEIVRKGYERILSEAGYDVHAASNGRDGLDELQKNRCDVVLTDLRMPEMDGLSMVREMRDSQPEVPVVVITGYPSDDTAEEAKKLRVRDYLTKPLAPPALLQATARALAGILDPAPQPMPVPCGAGVGAMPVQAVPEPWDPSDLQAAVAERSRAIGEGLKGLGMLLAAPFLGLAYVLFLPFAGIVVISGLAAETVWNAIRPGREER